MSDRPGHFLSRWSQRRERVRRAEEIEVETPPAPPQAATPPEGDPPQQPEPETADAPPAVEEPLPRVEDVTAQSDLTAFLRAGIPDSLRNAALRKAWSLDPLIRDFASPAEYDWNFNAPGSMAGFGPAGITDSTETLMSAVRQMQSSTESSHAPAAPPPEATATESVSRQKPEDGPKKAPVQQAGEPAGGRTSDASGAPAESHRPELLSDAPSRRENAEVLSEPGELPAAGAGGARRHGTARPS